MDNLDKELSEIFKSEIVATKSFQNAIQNALNTKDVKLNKNYNILKLVATFIITCICGMGIVFAGGATYKYLAKVSEPDVNIMPGSDPEIDAEYGIIRITENDDTDIWYKKISTYEDYQKCKKMWTNLYDMSENDFEDYFLVMISLGHQNPKLPFDVSDVNADEANLYIYLSQSENKNGDNTLKIFFSVKIERKYDRENVIIKKNFVTPNVSQYTDLKKIKDGASYPKEQAIKEGCFVVEFDGLTNEIISSDENQISNFVKNTTNGIEGFIRVASYDDTISSIHDIEYKNGKYYIATYIVDKRWADVDVRLIYNTYDKLTEHYATVDKVNWFHDIFATDNNSGTEDLIVSYK